MCWKIRIGRFSLGLLDAVKIHRSVDLLSDHAEIVLPAVLMNKALNLEGKLERGQEVEISLGYNGEMQTEFNGYLLEIGTDQGNMVLKCEDKMYLFRKPLPDVELKAVSLKQLLEYAVRETGTGLEIACSYDFLYDKYVVSGMTGYSLLKKLQEETRANVYIKEQTLHIHPAYEEIFGEVKYDFSKNIEKDNLVYKKAAERAFEVEVEGIGKDGSRVKVKVGTAGGDKRSIKVYGVTASGALKKRGEEEMKRLSYDGYEGDFTGWLIPYCEPGYVAKIIDEEYPEKSGTYYVTAVTTAFSRNGGSRKVQLGKKLK